MAVLAAVAVALVMLVPSGRRSFPAGGWPQGAPMGGFQGDGLQFTYPAAWRYQTQPWPSDGSAMHTLIALLSADHLRDYCHSYHVHDGEGMTCRGGILSQLPPGGVVVTWIEAGSQGFLRTGTGNGLHTTIAGLPATITQDNGASCRYWTGPGAQASIRAAIWISPYTRYSMSACMRGPGLREDIAAVYAMLHSVRRTHQQ